MKTLFSAGWSAIPDKNAIVVKIFGVKADRPQSAIVVLGYRATHLRREYQVLMPGVLGGSLDVFFRRPGNPRAS